MRSGVRFAARVLVPVAAMSLMVSTVPVAASPASVDYLVKTIGQKAQAKNWKGVDANISDLDRTIDDALNIKQVPVQVASNPLQKQLSDTQQRLDWIKSDYTVIQQALVKLANASAAQTRRVINDIATQFDRYLNLVRKPSLWQLANAIDVSSGQKLVTDIKQMRTISALTKYLVDLRNSLAPAIRETERDRAALIPLNEKYKAVMARYGITVGGPPVQPASTPPTPSGQHPRISGTWTEGNAGGCPGAVITIVQDTSGAVTSLTNNVTSCNGAWAGSNFRWTSTSTLEFDYTVTKNPGHWQNGRYTINFSSDGGTATGYWTVPGATGGVDWYKTS